jgi:hypothetical protein
MCMARLEEIQRQYVRRNKAKYPHISKEPSSSNQQANQATNALLPTPQGPKRNVPSFFDQHRSGQPTSNVSSSSTATNQQVVQGKSATNQQVVQGKSARNQQTVQGNVVAPNADFACFSIEAKLAKVKIPVPLKELAKNPSYQQSISKFMGCPVDEANLNDETPEIFLGKSKRDKNHMPFFMSLQINGLISRNCMLDLGASTNIMTLEVMNQLGLQITRPYRNVKAMDAREVECLGIIKDL